MCSLMDVYHFHKWKCLIHFQMIKNYFIKFNFDLFIFIF